MPPYTQSQAYFPQANYSLHNAHNPNLCTGEKFSAPASPASTTSSTSRSSTLPTPASQSNTRSCSFSVPCGPTTFGFSMSQAPRPVSANPPRRRSSIRLPPHLRQPGASNGSGNSAIPEMHGLSMPPFEMYAKHAWPELPNHQVGTSEMPAPVPRRLSQRSLKSKRSQGTLYELP